MKRFLTGRLVLTVILILSAFQSGCSYVQIVVSASTEAQLLRDGEKAFLLGNYEKAEELFLQVYNSESESQYKNTARYNLACTRMITAENSKTFKEAFSYLTDWKKPYHSGFYTENPTLVVTALKKSGSKIRQQADLLKAENRKLTKALEGQNSEIDNLEQNISNLRTLLTSYQEDSISAQEMIETLQRQINELEVIDQQLQEKKKPL